MELREYLGMIRRRWVLAATCLLLCLGAAAVITATMTPRYASSARLFVSTSRSDAAEAYQGGLFSAERVKSYADLVNSRQLASKVIDQLELDVTPSELVDQISARAVPETVNLELTAVSASPRQAQRIAQAYAEQLSAMVQELETPPGRGRAPIKATVVDAAYLSDDPVAPDPVRNLALAAAIGLLLGVGAAVLRELLDRSVKTAADLVAVTESPLMGAIPFDAQTRRQPLVTSLPPTAARCEAFRMLRTNLQFLDIDRNSKVFVVTSSLPEEGKTTTATNLAITLCEAGHRTVLVECDLRRPRIASILEADSAVGVTTVLLGRLSLDAALQAHHRSGLDTLTSGALPPNPAELLQSKAMSDLFSELRTRYDTVIVDAPPLLPVTDSALLAAQADAVLVVVRHGRTTKEELAHAAERLRQVDVTPAGIVFNMVRDKAGAYGYGYRYGYGSSRDDKGGPATDGRRRRGWVSAPQRAPVDDARWV